MEDVTGGRFQQLLAPPSGQASVRRAGTAGRRPGLPQPARPTAAGRPRQLRVRGHRVGARRLARLGGAQPERHGALCRPADRPGGGGTGRCIPTWSDIDALVLGGDGRPMPLGGLPLMVGSVSAPTCLTHPPVGTTTAATATRTSTVCTCCWTARGSYFYGADDSLRHVGCCSGPPRDERPDLSRLEGREPGSDLLDRGESRRVREGGRPAGPPPAGTRPGQLVRAGCSAAVRRHPGPRHARSPRREPPPNEPELAERLARQPARHRTWRA